MKFARTTSTTTLMLVRKERNAEMVPNNNECWVLQECITVTVRSTSPTLLVGLDVNRSDMAQHWTLTPGRMSFAKRRLPSLHGSRVCSNLNLSLLINNQPGDPHIGMGSIHNHYINLRHEEMLLIVYVTSLMTIAFRCRSERP